MLPLDLARQWLDRHHLSPALLRQEPGTTPSAASRLGKVAARPEYAVRLSSAAATSCRVVVFGGMLDCVLGEKAALVAGEDIEKPGQRTVAVRHPVRAAIDAGEDVVAPLRSGVVPGNHLGMSGIVEALSPRLTDETLRQQKLAVIPVQEVVKTISRRPSHQLAVA